MPRGCLTVDVLLFSLFFALKGLRVNWLKNSFLMPIFPIGYSHVWNNKPPA